MEIEKYLEYLPSNRLLATKNIFHQKWTFQNSWFIKCQLFRLLLYIFFKYFKYIFCNKIIFFCVKIQHPAAKLVVYASDMQEREVGDGTSFVIIFAGALLKNAEELLRMVRLKNFDYFLLGFVYMCKYFFFLIGSSYYSTFIIIV